MVNHGHEEMIQTYTDAISLDSDTNTNINGTLRTKHNDNESLYRVLKQRCFSHYRNLADPSDWCNVYFFKPD